MTLSLTDTFSDYDLLYSAAERQSRMLSGLKKSLETR